MNISIKHRIYWSFFLLVFLFVLNGIVTLLTLNSNKKLAVDIFKVMTPSLQSLNDFQKVLVESKMLMVNWVFLKSDQDDKKQLQKLHDSVYMALKKRINVHYSKWADKNSIDSLNRIYTGFEELLAIEKKIMASLEVSSDYDNPVIKLKAKQKLEEEILPRTAALIKSLKAIQAFALIIRTEEGIQLERSSTKLRMLIILLAITFIFSGFLLSMYMTKAIIRPLNSIRRIIDKLGQGIIEKIDHYHSRNEIGKMIGSVNTLSERLQATATFAQQVGLRNFDMPFKSLSDEDTLGKALVAMRGNIKSSDEKLNAAQHIAHLGSVEKDVATGKVFLSDEMFSILDVDQATFDYNFQNILKLIQPEYRDGFKKYRENYLYGDPLGDFECEILTPKGITKNVIIQSKLILDAKGKVTRIVGIVQDITERKKIEEQIKLSNERYELVIKTTNDMIWDWDLVNNTIFRNENYSKVFGLNAGDRNDVAKWVKNVHPDDVEWIEEYIRKKISDPSAESWEVEFRYYRHDNEMVYLHDLAYIIRNENKKAIRMVGATSDITERKKAEEALIESEQYNRNLFNQSPVGLALARMDGTLEDVNETYAKITGHTIEECKTLSYYEITPEKYSGQETERLKELELTGRYGPYEKEYIHKDGHLVPVMLSGTILITKGVKYIWSSVEDISERKIADIKLRKSEERYRQIVETAQEGIWLIDENKKTTFVNKRVCEMLGYSSGEMVGKDLFYFMDEEGKKIAAESLEKQIKNGTDHLDFKFLTKKGVDVWTYLATSAVLNDDGSYIGGLALVTDITNRKKAEENNKFKAELLNTVGQAVIATDMNGIINFWNRAAEEIYGWATEEAIDKNIVDLTPALQTKEQAIEIMNELSEGRSWSGEFVVQRKDGTTFPAFVTDSPIYDQHHKLSGIIGVSSDITDRKKTAEALSNNELRFRTLTGSAPVGIFQTDIEGKTIYVNETWLEYTGMTFEETLGDGWLAAIHPVDREIMMKDWNDKSEKGLESSTEYRLIDKKGNVKWVMGKAVPIFNKSGKILGHIGTVSDITERKQAIELLEQSENKYRQIVETAQEGIWLIDENNYISFFNQKMCEILGYSAEEMKGKKLFDFMDADGKKNALPQIENRKQKINGNYDVKYITKSGKPIWTNISTNSIFGEDGKYKGALAMVTDITHRKSDEELLHQSEIKLAAKNKELEQKNKELEQFAYVASHDLQEPLRTTSSFVNLLEEQYRGRLDEKADKYIHYIVESSDRMKTLITDLLEFSRIGSKKELKEIDCNTVLQEVLQDLGAAIKETGAKITAGTLPVISGYPEIKQLFQNLVFNSIKFRQKNIPPVINISVQYKGDGWQFAFADNGIGIAKENHERIFIIFQRLHTRNVYPGSGIGLSHCKKIVELHRGKIWLESERGKGTTFYFTIPQKK